MSGAPIPAVGVDIGGSKILAVVVDDDGRVVDTEARVTPGRSVAVALVEDAMVDAIGSLQARHGRSTVGIGAAGFVDRDGERVMFAPHLPWRDERVGQRVGRRLQETVVGSVVLDNDANAALWAEARFGARRTADDVVMVTMGTGIGGAMLLGGRLHRGRNGMAGEFGHAQVVPAGRPCECGNAGCWEQYASGRALARAAAARGSDLVGPALTAAAQSGDPDAIAAFAEVGHWLGVGLANLTGAYDPTMILIGGGVAAAGDLLLDPARESLSCHLVGRGHRVEPEVAVATLGPMAGAIGAADLARVHGR